MLTNESEKVSVGVVLGKSYRHRVMRGHAADDVVFYLMVAFSQSFHKASSIDLQAHVEASRHDEKRWQWIVFVDVLDRRVIFHLPSVGKEQVTRIDNAIHEVPDVVHRLMYRIRQGINAAHGYDASNR